MWELKRITNKTVLGFTQTYKKELRSQTDTLVELTSVDDTP